MSTEAMDTLTQFKFNAALCPERPWTPSHSSSSVLLYVHRDHGHSHTVQVQCCFMSREAMNTLTQFKFSAAWHPQRPKGLLGTWSPGRPPQTSHSSGLSSKLSGRNTMAYIYIIHTLYPLIHQRDFPERPAHKCRRGGPPPDTPTQSPNI